MYETLAWEPIVVGLPAAHHLVSAERLPLRGLAKERCIMFKRERNPGLYDEIIALCRKGGFSLNAIHEVDSVYGGSTLVAAGIGLALFPASAAYPREGVVFRHVEGRLPKMQSVIVYRRGVPSNALRVFLDIVRTISKKAVPRRRRRLRHVQNRQLPSVRAFPNLGKRNPS